MSASSRGRRRPTVYIESLEPRVFLSTYTVTSLADDGSAGTLRWAVQQANVNPGPDTINFAAGLTGTIMLTSGQLEISDTSGQTTIAGPGSGLNISGFIAPGQWTRDIVVDPGAATSISGLGLTGKDSGPVGGGVLFNNGTVTLSGCGLSGTASNDGGAIYNNGGEVTITECYLGNANIGSGQGGGIYNASGVVHVDYTTFQTAGSYNGGGAIANYGTLMLAHSSVENSGSVTHGAVENIGTMAVTDSTFWNYGYVALYSAGTLTIGNSTIYNSINVAGFLGVSVADGTGNTTIYNSIVDSISGAVDQHLAPGQAPSSYDLIVGTQSGGLVKGVNGNLVGVNPMLSPIGPYGGPTETLLPLPGSPAIDAGSNALAIDLTGATLTPLQLDQGGFPRIYNGAVDIGAVEVQPKLVNTTVADNGVDYGGPGQFTFDDAFQLNARALAGGTVRFDPTVFTRGVLHTVQMSGGLAESVARPVTVAIRGLGADAIALNMPAEGAFSAAPGATLFFSGVAITGARMQTAIVNGGTVALTDCAVYGNAGGPFAAIINEPGGALVLTDSSFFDNSAMQGGEGSALDNQGSASITRCTFSNNASAFAGAIYNRNGGSLMIFNSTFSGNSAKIDGDSAVNNLSTAAIYDSTFTGNSGGGIRSSGRLVVDNTIIAGNAAVDGKTPSDLRAIATGSNNLIGTGGSGGLMNGVNGNIVGVADPKLAPLGDYGGPTQTMPPLPGSPAIDAGSNALAVGADGKPLPTDQRGYYRIFNGTVDIGAVEYGSSPLLPGDANADHKVDFADLVILARSYGQTNATWAQGDFDGDGKVDFSDLVILARNYGKSAPAAAAAVQATADVAGAMTPGIDVHARTRATRIRLLADRRD